MYRRLPARLLALVLCVAVALATQGCITTHVREDFLSPQPGRAGLVVRVFDNGDDLKAGRLTRRAVTSTVEDADGVVFEAIGPEWWVDDADPGVYRLTVKWDDPSSSTGIQVVQTDITLVEGRSLGYDVQAKTGAGHTVAAVLLSAVVLVGMAYLASSSGGWSSSSRRPTEPLPSGVAARRVHGGETTP